MTTQGERSRSILHRGGRVVKWFSMLVVFTAAVLLTGIGVVALLSQTAADGTWSRWSDVGETFGAVNTVFSGLALAALVITFWVQFQELRTQRSELTLQGEALSRSQADLHRTAEASLRMLHMQLLKMGINDPDLAAVWPPLEPGLPHERSKQFMYANLIFQYSQSSLRIGGYDKAHIEANLRYLFSSPIMRDYWRAAVYARSFVPPGTAEFEFCQMADGICTEYEQVCANVGLDTSRRRDASWERLDADSSAKTP